MCIYLYMYILCNLYYIILLYNHLNINCKHFTLKYVSNYVLSTSAFSFLTTVQSSNSGSLTLIQYYSWYAVHIQISPVVSTLPFIVSFSPDSGSSSVFPCCVSFASFHLLYSSCTLKKKSFMLMFFWRMQPVFCRTPHSFHRSGSMLQITSRDTT